MNFLLSALDYAYGVALKQMQINLFGRLLSYNAPTNDLASYYRVVDVLATTRESLDPLHNIITGITLLSFMALVVSVATLNSRRSWFHNLMISCALFAEAFGLVISYYYNNQLDVAIANARKNLVTAVDWKAYLRVAPTYERVYAEVYGFWGVPYSLLLAISVWVILIALGVAVFTANWSSPPVCKVCMRKMTPLDKKERKWYCATDDRLLLEKQHQVIENASKQAPLVNEIRAKAEETGQVTPETLPSMMFCRECGTKIPRDSKFCKQCGAKLV